MVMVTYKNSRLIIHCFSYEQQLNPILLLLYYLCIFEQRADKLFPLLFGVVGCLRCHHSIHNELWSTRDGPRGSVLPGIAGMKSNVSICETLHYPACVRMYYSESQHVQEHEQYMYCLILSNNAIV